jgi:hypothetical protein
MKVYSSDEVRISHGELVNLRSAGKVSLGIDDYVAQRIAADPSLKPAKTTAAAAFHFWNWVVILGLLYTVYLSFTAQWWWFIVGLVSAGIVRSANRHANQENMLDAAMIDRDFYERTAELRGWLYRMEPHDAEPFLTKDYRDGEAALVRFRSGLNASE